MSEASAVAAAVAKSNRMYWTRRSIRYIVELYRRDDDME